MTASTDIDGGQSSTHNDQTPGATVEPTTTATPPAEQVVADPAEAFAALGLGSDALRAIRELGYRRADADPAADHRRVARGP